MLSYGCWMRRCALQIGQDSVELAMEWMDAHPEEAVPEQTGAQAAAAATGMPSNLPATSPSLAHFWQWASHQLVCAVSFAQDVLQQKLTAVHQLLL